MIRVLFFVAMLGGIAHASDDEDDRFISALAFLPSAQRLRADRVNDYAGVCERSTSCAGACKETLTWLHEKAYSHKPPPTFCSELRGKSEKAMVTWIRGRIAQAVAATRPRLSGDRLDALDCGWDGLNGKNASTDKCLAVDARATAHGIHELRGIDWSMVDVLTFKLCQESNDCAGPCPSVMLALASVSDDWGKNVRPSPGCSELPSRKETEDAFRARANPWFAQRFADYIDRVRSHLGIFERAKLDADLQALAHPAKQE